MDFCVRGVVTGSLEKEVESPGLPTMQGYRRGLRIVQCRDQLLETKPGMM
jgi:hypothetical protein